MDAYLIAVVIAGGGVLGVVVWLLAKVGKVSGEDRRGAGRGCGGVRRRVAGRQGRGVGDSPGGHPLAHESDRAGDPGVVSLVGLDAAGDRPWLGRCGADGVAADRRGVVRRVGGSASAGLVAALDGLCTEAARVGCTPAA